MQLTKQADTAEFKELAVKRGKEGQSLNVVLKDLRLSAQTLHHWVKAAAQGKLNGAGSRVVTRKK
jgi:transposase